MAGILNNKERIIDTIITQEGLKQASSGKLKAEFVSFTDSQAIYNIDTIVSGGLDATHRFVLEATSFPQDLITLETDNAGLLHNLLYSGSQSFAAVRGQIVSGSTIISGSNFLSLVPTVLSSSANNFKNLYILQSPDPIDIQEKTFLIGPNVIEFKITEDKPIHKNGIQTATLENLESLFYDERLSHVPNFQFLPPVNKSFSASEPSTVIGEYINLQQKPIITYQQVLEEIQEFKTMGFVETIRFTETSNKSNLFAQFFEISNNSTISKLKIIDFGEFQVDDEGFKHVFFVGKLFVDSNGLQTFINLFTLIFEKMGNQ